MLVPYIDSCWLEKRILQTFAEFEFYRTIYGTKQWMIGKGVSVLRVTLEAVKHIKKLRNLYSLYLYDLSEFSYSLSLNTDGLYEFEGFDKVIEREELQPYFIQYEGECVGFLLLAERPFTASGTDYCINDVFILRAFRGRGLASDAVYELLQQRSGYFCVPQLQANERALQFWRSFYARHGIFYREEHRLIDGEPCTVHTFNV